MLVQLILFCLKIKFELEFLLVPLRVTAVACFAACCDFCTFIFQSAEHCASRDTL